MCRGTAQNLYLLILVAAAVGVSDFPGVSVIEEQAGWEKSERLVSEAQTDTACWPLS